MKSDQGREYLGAIHSELELRQVTLPDDMTVLQKLVFEDRKAESLPDDIKTKVDNEVKRLRECGIRPPLGTLTQKVLASPPARKRLREDYGLEVVEEKRLCGIVNGVPRYDTFLVTANLPPQQ
ncbi:hypothetical protein E1189_00615 [Sansalvadorimonas verongulae]|nr:hypothetical protein [Sansalvadorimonas verongulae]